VDQGKKLLRQGRCFGKLEYRLPQHSGVSHPNASPYGRVEDNFISEPLLEHLVDIAA
jgi:hypothetical protein